MQPGAQQPRQTAGTGAAAAGRDTRFSPLELEHLRLALQASAVQHGTHLQHTPLNLVLALTGEVGSLAQLFQWRRDTSAGQLNLTTSEQQQLSEQLSGILLHLIRLSNVCQIDLARAALEKLSRDHEAIQQVSQGRRPAQQQHQQQHQLVLGQRPDQARSYMPASPVVGSYTSSAIAAAAAAAASAAGETASAGAEQHLAQYFGLEAFAHPAAAAAAASTGLQLSVSRWGGSGLGFTGHGLLRQTSAQTTSTVATPSSHQTVMLQAGLSDSSEQITAAAAAAAAAGLPGGQVVPPSAAAAAAMQASAGGGAGALSIDVLRLLATLASEDPASAIGLLAANPTATETLLQELSDPDNPARALLPAALGQQGTQHGALQQIAGPAAAAITAAALPRFREVGWQDPAAAAAAGSSMYQGRGLVREREISAQLKREDLTAGSTSRRPRPSVTGDATAAAAAAAGQQQQAADVSRSRMMAHLAVAAAVPPAAAVDAAEAVERVMSGGLPPLPAQLAAAAGATPAPAAGQPALQPSFGASPTTGSLLAAGGLTGSVPGATTHPAAGKSPEPQPTATPAAAAVAAAAAAAAAAATGTISPANLPESEMEEFGTDVRRKRFSDHEVQALTRIAELANWSLTNLSLQEREAVCNTFHVGINRLQNFFNNRKPKGLKRGRPRAHQSHGPAYSMPGMQGYIGLEEGYHLFQQQQQQQGGLVATEGGVGYGVLHAAAAAALAAVGGLQEHSSGPYYDVSQGHSRSHSPATHQQQAIPHMEPAAAATAAAAAGAAGKETLASPRQKRRAASEQAYAYHEPLARQDIEGHVSPLTPQGLTGTTGQGLQIVRPVRVQRTHSSEAQGFAITSQGSAPTSQGFAITCQGFAATSQGFAVTSQGLDLGPFGTPLAQGLQAEGVGAPGAQGLGATAMAMQGSEQQQQQQGIAAAAIATAAAAALLGPGCGSSGFGVQPAAAGMTEGPELTPATTVTAPTAAAPPPPWPAPTPASAQAPAQALVPDAAEHAAGLTVAVPDSHTPTAAAAAATDGQATDGGAGTAASPPVGYDPAGPAGSQQ